MKRFAVVTHEEPGIGGLVFRSVLSAEAGVPTVVDGLLSLAPGVERGEPVVVISQDSGDEKTSQGSRLMAVSPKHAREFAKALLDAADEADGCLALCTCVNCGRRRDYVDGYTHGGGGPWVCSKDCLRLLISKRPEPCGRAVETEDGSMGARCILNDPHSGPCRAQPEPANAGTVLYSTEWLGRVSTVTIGDRCTMSIRNDEISAVRRMGQPVPLLFDHAIPVPREMAMAAMSSHAAAALRNSAVRVRVLRVRQWLVKQEEEARAEGKEDRAEVFSEVAGDISDGEWERGA